MGDPLDKNTDVGAINSRAQLDEDRGARRERASRRARRCTSRRASCPSAGSGSRRRCSPASRSRTGSRARRSSGPVLSITHVPHARGSRREGEQHAVRAVGRRLDREGLADPVDGRAPARRRRVGEHVQPVRPGVAVRRLQGVRVRPRGRAATAWSRTCGWRGGRDRPTGSPSVGPRSCSSAAPSRGASRAGPTRSVGPRRASCWRTRRAPRARTCATRWSPRARRPRRGRRPRRSCGARSSTGSPS